ncbi:MAG: STAS domain-containing protein [Fusobacteria bacterium]|jgi:anti-anti-sigma factor|nr:STAS domain-containing protein [Fusobacteriota bacterium]
MKIEGYLKDKKYIVVMSEQLNLEKESEIKNFFENLIEDERILKNGMRLQIELSNVHYMDSVIIGFFIGLKKKLEIREIELDFINAPEIIFKIFKILSLDKYFNFFEFTNWSEENE